MIPGPRHVVRTPDRCRRIVERRLISLAHLEWRRSYRARDGATPNQWKHANAIICRVLIPARYVEHIRLVQTSPACRCQIEGPPRCRRVERTVLVARSHDLVRRHPAVYRASASMIGRSVPPIQRAMTASPARHRALRPAAALACSQMSAPKLARLQRELSQSDYDGGPAAGVPRAKTDFALSTGPPSCGGTSDRRKCPRTRRHFLGR